MTNTLTSPQTAGVLARLFAAAEAQEAAHAEQEAAHNQDGAPPVPRETLTAQELADALEVDRNTVLAAYRQLRDSGVLEFRRQQIGRDGIVRTGERGRSPRAELPRARSADRRRCSAPRCRPTARS